MNVRPTPDMETAILVQPPDIHPNCAERLASKKGLKRAVARAFDFVPRHTYLPLLHELRVAWRRLGTGKERVRFRNARGLLVNIGCGSSGKPGWINTDIDPHPGVNCFWDCRKSLPFPDNSVKWIFTEHFVEHLDYTEEIPYILTDCYRVLEPGGVIRIIVPDAEKYLRGYCCGDWDELARVRPLGPGLSDVHFGSKYNTKIELVNVVFRQYFEHKFAWDHETMEFVLRRFGFSRVYHQSFGQSLAEGLAIDRSERASESLYVEGVK
jgi:predicted SAM-dependent methyltransferase